MTGEHDDGDDERESATSRAAREASSRSTLHSSNGSHADTLATGCSTHTHAERVQQPRAAPNQTADKDSPSRRRKSHIVSPPTSSLRMAPASSASAVGSTSAGSVKSEKVAV